MNLLYLGDALDHWKGSLFEDLGQAGLLRDLAVDAMCTDAEHWRSADHTLYARLLRVRRNQLVHHRRSLKEDRTAYFREVEHKGDLFLDPDTGIATYRVRNRQQYVFPAEVHDLLSARPNGAVAVYQHVSRKRTRDRLQRVVSALEQPDQPFSCCSYESGTVAMLSFSRQAGRIEGIYQHFKEILGRHSARRSYLWQHPAGDV